MPESSKMGSLEFSNAGNPETTALLIAFELMKKKSDLVGLTDDQLSEKLGSMADKILKPIKERRNPLTRSEPDDPIPGCAEPPQEACDWPKDKSKTGISGIEGGMDPLKRGSLGNNRILIDKNTISEHTSDKPDGALGRVSWEDLGK